MIGWFKRPRRSVPDLRQPFALPFRGGEIWVVCAGGLGDDVELTKQKIIENAEQSRRPSISSLVLYDLNETEVSLDIAGFLWNRIMNLQCYIKKLALVGVGVKDRRNLQKALEQTGMALEISYRCFEDMEPAKEWLVGPNR